MYTSIPGLGLLASGFGASTCSKIHDDDNDDTLCGAGDLLGCTLAPFSVIFLSWGGIWGFTVDTMHHLLPCAGFVLNAILN